MNWYYVDAGRQAGPVDDAGLDALVATGKITNETLVWRDGMANWAAYGTVRPGGTGQPGVASGAEAVCAECGQLFPVNDTIQIGGARVCANCKPVFVQKMREGVAAPTAPAGSYVTEDQVLAREYQLEIGNCVERGWGAFTANAGVMVATALVIGIILIATSFISGLIGRLIPLSNWAISLLIGPPMMGGVALFSLKALRGEAVGVGDGFSGFGPRYWQLVLLALVQFVINFVCALPAGIVFVIVFMAGAVAGARVHAPSLAAGAIIALMFGMLLIVGLLIVINSLWLFAPLLIMDKGYDFWPAMQLSRRMVAKRLGGTVVFYIVAGIIYIVGFLLCLIGGLVTAPLYMNIKSAVYEDNFRDLVPRR